jgi:ribonuclease BN (tRNA processing enzyme)
MEYGGETTALIVEGAAGERVLIDAGSGLKTISSRIGTRAGPPSPLLLLTHLHLDHILGLPSLDAVYEEGFELEVATVWRGLVDASEALGRVFAPPVWVMPVDKLPAQISIRQLPDPGSGVALQHGQLMIRSCVLHHPGGCCGYRIDEPASGSSFVFATDFEWQISSETEKAALIELCTFPESVDLLILDGMFTPEDYPARRGWGHSTWQDAVEISRSVAAKQSLITHHDPTSDDLKLGKNEKEVQAALPSARLARQGMEVELGR